jgi:hypothetical protein
MGCVLLAVAAAGCGHHFAHRLPTAKAPPPELPIVPRGKVEPDISALPLDTNGKAPTRPENYRKLTAAECRVLAIKNAPFADDLDQHPGNTAPPHPLLHPLKPTPAEAEQGRLVRGYAADEFRNRAAGEALEQFFQLAQAEGQFDLLAKSLAELRARLADAEEALKRGLTDRAGVDALRVQVLGLEAQVAQLEAGIGGLNAGLRARLGLEAADPLPLWPDDPLRVRPDDPDTDEAVRTGLYYRPDLNLLRALLADEGRAADDLMQSLLKQVSPLMGRLATNPIVGILLPRGRKTDREATRRQVESMLAARERQADAEIRAAVLSLRGHRLSAAAKAAEVRRLAAKVQEVEKRAAAGQQVTAELTKARLDHWKAQGELLKAAADWNIAEVKLRQAMGLLVRE